MKTKLIKGKMGRKYFEKLLNVDVKNDRENLYDMS